MANIDVRYEAWKKKLLDLGKRNRLMNYRDTARSNVTITYPECGALYDAFVKNETELVFPFESDSDESGTNAECASNVETNKSVADLQKTLRNLRDKAKTAIEEQGVNVLHLSFGFLKWTESDDSEHVFTSPIILVPVTLIVESITSPYKLKLHEDEIVLNPNLAYKLENDFGITLPPFDETSDIEQYFEEVRANTKIKNWSVDESVGLSLLSFLKINMYTDLSKHKDSIVSNPIVRAISGDTTAISRVPEDVNDFDFDKQEKPVDIFQVVDADASQQDAILMAKKGVSFVLQGPPGTGKSQTITNIIAECLADGKKVLFVSEKMAALDVVHRRLASAGLDDFCLVLHSHKANKKSVLEQLGKVLDLSQKKATLSDAAYRQLDLLQDSKDRLNAYAEQVYTIVDPLGKSIYEVNGIIANLEAYEEFIFSIEDIRNVSREQYNRYSYLIDRFTATIGKMTDDYKENPWRGCRLSSVSNEFRHDVTARTNELLESLKRTISYEYNWFVSNFNDVTPFREAELISLSKRLDACVNNLFLLEEWIDYSTARTNCISGGLGDFIRVIEMHNIPVQDIMPIFKKRFFRLWLDAVLPELPAVLNFRRKMQESTIGEFGKLDRVQFEIAKARIRSKLINDLPSLERFTSGVDEISILKRELGKQRRIMPIRRLFKAIPNLLLTLKPCLMMSPLSVSLFLEADTYKFDIVIFDEASQVCTENAIGAISRAKQVVIAGDSKQLPPTNFFQAAITESDFDTVNDDDDYEDADAYESILDEAAMLPERTLRWHYRSRHESLIAFSNAKIYRNNLITFPSYVESLENSGVEYVYVPEGWYDRGGKKGNVVEANKVADLVFKHFREQPSRSLGVIAFGEVQQQAIETVIRERRIRNQEYEAFFAEDREEAFFVKNLENVQGDERDTIIFSIGYAKDASGVFRMNFGPLSKSGGERRLNVAITRAKYNIKLVGSIKPTDINTDKISSEGPKLLRAYIDFAINGYQVLEREITESDVVEHDSPFEEAVYNFLDRKGYKVATQVGCSGYRIDMAVKHPTISGIYVLGVECDGAAYHSARTARERDRLRQDILENMGWNIYRIWSTDWIKDPITEGAKLIETIENAMAKYGVDESNTITKPEADVEAVCASDFVNEEEKVVSADSIENPYGFEDAVITDFSTVLYKHYGYVNVKDCVKEAIYNEYPIHFDLLCQRIAPLLGNEKATVKVRREVEYALSQWGGAFLRKNDFLFPRGYKSIPIRLPNTRKIQHISIEELSEAMYRILKTCIGTTREALCAETTRVYGFNRAGQNISLAMSSAVDLLLSTGKAEEIDGKLKIVQ